MKARTRSALVPLVLLAAVAVAVAYAYYGVERKGEQEKARKEAEEKLFTFAKEGVKELTVEARGSTVKLTRAAGGGWRIVSPLEAEADRAVVDALVDQVAGLRRKQAIGASDLARYGLEKPRARVTLLLEEGKTESLALGDQSGFDGSLFVRPTSGAVELVEGGAKTAIEKELFDLREKRLLNLQDQELQRIEVTAPRLAYTLERADGGWKLVKPLAEKADAVTAEQVAGALRGLRATQFAPQSKPDQEYGLDRPRYQVKVVGPAGVEKRLVFGAVPTSSSPAPASLIVRIDSSRELATVEETQVRAVDQELWGLRDKTVLLFDRDKVEAIRFEQGSNSLEVRKGAASGGGTPSWSFQPGRSPASAWKVSDLLYRLSSLRATGLADESGKALATHGLDKPAQVVTLQGAGGVTLARLEVGKQNGEKLFVRGSSPRIYEVERSQLSELPKTQGDLEDKAPSK